MRGLQAGRSSESTGRRLLSALMTRLPGAWVNPSKEELISLYRLRYRMAVEEKKFDIALVFLNKILEERPLDLEAKFEKAVLYHHHLHDFARAIEHYTKVIALTQNDQRSPLRARARTSVTEIMELLS